MFSDLGDDHTLMIVFFDPFAWPCLKFEKISAPQEKKMPKTDATVEIHFSLLKILI